MKVYVLTDMGSCCRVRKDDIPEAPRVRCFSADDVTDNLFEQRLKRKEKPWAVLVMEAELFMSYFKVEI